MAVTTLARATSPAASAGAKIPPQALEAEQALLGGLLLDNRAWDEVVHAVGAQDFYHANHRLIFTAIGDLQQNGNPADVVTVSHRLEQKNELEKAGGAAYLGALANDTPSAANIVTYAKIVREHAVLRALIDAAGDISALAYAPAGKDSREVLDHAEHKVFSISDAHARGRSDFVSMKTLAGDARNRIDELGETTDGITGLATGFVDLDKNTSGLQPGDLIVVAGRPSMGKTAFALNIAEHVALEPNINKPVAIFSMEMPGAQLAMRMLSAHGRINMGRIRSGQIRDDEWPRLLSAEQLLGNAPIYINSMSRLNPLELRSMSRRFKRQHNDLGLIIIDYIQLMEDSASVENRVTEVSKITRALKMLAMELEVPVIALSQLNRSVDKRDEKRPVMSDLRESGSIEQDADVILFVYRDEKYNKDSADVGRAEIIIGKQRNGPVGTVKLTFLGQFTRFENFAGDEYEGGEYGGA